MRKTIILATFVGVGAGTVGVGAAETMKGSDTLYDVTRDVVATCLDKVGGVNVPLDINYIGTGSGAGEDAMTKVASATQRLAPMSRFVQGAACAPLDANASSRKAEGVNFALDGLSIVSSKDTGASAACNGTLDCNRATDPNAGFVHNKTVTLTMKKIVPGPNGAIEELSLAGDDVYEGAPDVVGAEGVLPGPDGILQTTIAAAGVGGPNDDRIIDTTISYTFSDWKDVLRILLAGKFTHSWTENGSTVSTTSAKDCDNNVRHVIADNYAQVFQTDCTTGNCAKVHHIFRRDDVSGTTDTVIDLLGLTKTVWIGKTGYFSPFCNGFSQTAAGVGLPPCDLRKDITSPSAAAVAAYDWDQQDWDPIRRKCRQDEKVCGRNSTLGMVLPMLPTDFLAVDDAFPPVQAKDTIGFKSGLNAPNAYVIASNDGSVVPARCPNGGAPTGTLKCTGPFSNVDKNGNAVNQYSNINNPANAPAAVLSSLWCGSKGTQADGRVYNLYLRKNTSSAGVFQVDTRTSPNPDPRPIVAAYYRIHQVAGSYVNAGFDPSGGPLATPLTPQCVDQDATRQIGCLASVSKCSFGYAGNAALTGAPAGFTVDAVQQDALYPDDACVQKLVTDPANAYPIARKLFFSTVFGLESALTDEKALVECASKQSYISAIAANRGFTPMPVAPVCADLDEVARCPGTAAPNQNACANNNTITVDPRVTANGTSVPSNTDVVIP